MSAASTPAAAGARGFAGPALRCANKTVVALVLLYGTTVSFAHRSAVLTDAELRPPLKLVADHSPATPRPRHHPGWMRTSVRIP